MRSVTSVSCTSNLLTRVGLAGLSPSTSNGGRLAVGIATDSGTSQHKTSKRK